MTWAALAAGIAAGTTSLAVPAAGATLAGTAVPAMGVTGAMSGAGLGAGAAGAAGAGLGAAEMSPALAGMNLSEAAPLAEAGQGGIGQQLMQPITEFSESMPSLTQSAENIYQGDVLGELANPGKTPSMPDPGVGAMPQAGPISESNIGSSPMDWDWRGAQDKAERFIKLSKSVQDFAGAMRGEPPSNQKLSEAAPRPQQAQPYQQRPPAAPVMPATRLMPDTGNMDPRMRLRMLQGY